MMAEHGLGEIIAERSFDIKTHGGRNLKIHLKVGRPIKIEEGHWACPYFYDGIPGEKVRRIHGIDSLQALMLTLKFVTEDFESSANYYGIFKDPTPLF